MSKKVFCDLETHIDNSRKVKKLKGHKDRLIDALRALVSATVILDDKSDELKKALDKSWRALKLSCDDHHESH